MSQRFSLNVDGKSHNVDVDPDMPLLYALRNDVGLNSPHFSSTVRMLLRAAPANPRSDPSPRRSRTRYSTQPVCAFAGLRFSPDRVKGALSS